MYHLGQVVTSTCAECVRFSTLCQCLHQHSIPNGLAPVPVAVDGSTSYDFAVASRQAFTRVTGNFVDLGDMKRITIIQTNVVSKRSSLVTTNELQTDLI